MTCKNTNIIYGIRNCDKTRAALKWLDSNRIKYEFHDYKKFSLKQKKLEEWLDAIGWSQLINKKGTTWKKLSPKEQKEIDQQKSMEPILNHLSLIKRPLLERNENLYLGFDSKNYENILLTQR